MENFNKTLSQAYYDLVAAVASVRLTVTGASNTLTEQEFEILEAALGPFTVFKTIELFLNDCRRSVNAPLDFSDTRDYVFAKKEPIVISFFKAPYNTHLSLDAFVYNIEKPDAHFVLKFKSSMATSINIESCTEGFDQYPTCVALFPENFRALRPFAEQFSVFYFLNVFIRRFEEYGRPVLEQYISDKAFWRLKRLSKADLLRSFSTWHYLHEYFHSTGDLPLAENLKVKSTKNTSAIEESRVDVLSVLECMESARNGYYDAYFYAELILFERLLRYATHSDPVANYDSRSSLILFNFLEQNQAIRVDEAFRLSLERSNLRNMLMTYIEEIARIEGEIKAARNAPVAEVPENVAERQMLGEFAERYSGKNVSNRNKFLTALYRG
jgi:hypothetical protein